jgi:hypothetical protein
MSEAMTAPAGDAMMIARVQKNGFRPIVSQCVGCGHVRLVDGVGYCASYAQPDAKWAMGMCNFATHAKIEKAKDTKFVNPLKASKRGGK